MQQEETDLSIAPNRNHRLLYIHKKQIIKECLERIIDEYYQLPFLDIHFNLLDMVPSIAWKNGKIVGTLKILYRLNRNFGEVSIDELATLTLQDETITFKMIPSPSFEFSHPWKDVEDHPSNHGIEDYETFINTCKDNLYEYLKYLVASDEFIEREFYQNYEMSDYTTILFSSIEQAAIRLQDTYSDVQFQTLTSPLADEYLPIRYNYQIKFEIKDAQLNHYVFRVKLEFRNDRRNIPHEGQIVLSLDSMNATPMARINRKKIVMGKENSQLALHLTPNKAITPLSFTEALLSEINNLINPS